jgi:hypothetical protein
MFRVGAEVDQWQRLETYRQRYQIEDRLASVASLEKSIRRRRMRSAGLDRRLGDLQEQIAAVRSELAAVESEIEGSRQAGALLIEEILDQVQIDMGEAWSPTPVLGYRVWRIEDDRVMGNQVHWESPTLSSRCLREVPGEDLPHAVERCGPPACGIYAVKSLDMFPPGVAQGVIHNSVVGMVAMHGKVVEHEEGYRSQRAMAVALSANDGVRRLITADPGEIDRFFSEPVGTMAQAPPKGSTDDIRTREFLASVHTKEEEWT